MKTTQKKASSTEQLSDSPTKKTTMEKKQMKNQRYVKKKIAESNKKICEGINHNLTPCKNYQLPDSEYCQVHKEELAKYSDEQIVMILNKQMKNCGICKKWHNEKTAQHKKCNDEQTTKRNEQIIEDRKNGKICKGITRERKLCPATKIINNSGYCRVHEYQKDYSPEDIQKSTLCTGYCHQLKLIESGSWCKKCRDDKNEKRRAETAAKGQCNGIKKDKNPCTRKAEENGYCGKHQPKEISIETEIICGGYIPKKMIIDGKKTYVSKQCEDKAKNNNKYCGKHIDQFSNLSPEQIEVIKNNQGKICSKTVHWHFGQLATCNKCSQSNTGYRNDHKSTPEEIAAKKCNWKDRNNEPCREYKINETNYCNHHQYVAEYTPEMLKNIKQCSGGCGHFKYLGDFDTCDYCRNAGKITRDNYAANKIICKGVKPNGPCTNEAQENGYCGHHKAQFIKNEIEKDGTKKVCREYKRGCRTILDISYSNSGCVDCLKAEQLEDKKRALKNALKISLMVAEINKDYENQEKITKENKLDNFIDIDEKGNKTFSCKGCKKYYPIANFMTSKTKPSLYCNVRCQEYRNEKEKTRSKRDRKEYSKQYEAKQHKKELRKLWRKLNRGKQAEYDRRCKEKQIATYGLKAYLAKEAAQMKKWRDCNPDQVKRINKEKRLNKKSRYEYYERRAFKKGIHFDMTLEECTKYFLADCYYCGVKANPDEQLNGIDRKDNMLGYVMGNCVTCCEMCNYMKKAIDHDKFIKICEHILAYLGICEGELHPEYFNDYKGCTYNHYFHSAKTRDYDFELTQSEFYKCKDNSCYLCGKNNSDSHKNGIDRMDNDIGYTKDNCKPCCGTCNYLKNSYIMNELLTKLVKIHEHHYEEHKLFDNAQDVIIDLVKPFVFDVEVIKNNPIESYVEKFETKIIQTNDISKNKSESSDDDSFNEVFKAKFKTSNDKKKQKSNKINNNTQLADKQKNKLINNSQLINKPHNELENDGQLKNKPGNIQPKNRSASRQNARNIKRIQMGDEAYKEKMRIEKAIQEGRVNANGAALPKKPKLTEEEKKEKKRLQKQKERALLKEKQMESTK